MCIINDTFYLPLKVLINDGVSNPKPLLPTLTEPQAVFAYFRDTMPTTGWALTSSSFSKASLLTFTKAERVATVQMQGTNFGGNDVLITVAPAVRAGATRP